MKKEGFYLVAVHGGAGFHTKSDLADAEVRHALRLACRTAVGLLQNGGIALAAAEQAISILEDEPCLNAGYGSNLTLSGSVECDAALMDGCTGDFGSVGAVSGIKNPVKAARAILENSRVRDPLGRIPPLLLVSHGARSFAQQRDVMCVPPESLVAERSQREWERWKSHLDTTNSVPSGENMNGIQDTVGAVTWGTDACLAAGVSSGGLLLKYPGRVGEAALYGAGCWARNASNAAGGVACSVSGTGEYIIRCMIAKEIAESLATSNPDETHDVLERVLAQQFHDVCIARGDDDPNIGVLLVTQTRGEDGIVQPRLWCAFTSESMSVAYASSLNPRPKAVVLRRPPESGHRTTSSLYITALPLTNA